MFFSFLFTCALSGNMKKRLLMPSRGKTLKLRSAYARRANFSFICWLFCALWLMSLCAPSVLMSKCSLGNRFHPWLCCSPSRLFTCRWQVVQLYWRHEVPCSELITSSSSWGCDGWFETRCCSTLTFKKSKFHVSWSTLNSLQPKEIEDSIHIESQVQASIFSTVGGQSHQWATVCMFSTCSRNGFQNFHRLKINLFWLLNRPQKL